MNNVPVYDIGSLSEFRSQDILISRFAPYLKNHHKLRLPHRHNFYHIVLFTDGGGEHTIDFEKFKVNPFQIYFMVPGQVHSWDFEGNVDGYVINFSPSFFQSFLLRPDYLEGFGFFQGITSESVIEIPGGLHTKLTGLFEDMLNAKQHAGKFELDNIRLLILQLFILVNELSFEDGGRAQSSYNVTLLKNFQRLIEKNFTELRFPKEYAELLYITPNHLNAICNEMLGLSAGELIRNRVLLEAKRLLVNMDLSVSGIAYQLNFNDNSYFTKFFKKQVGITPDEFRRQVFKNNRHEKYKNK